MTERTMRALLRSAVACAPLLGLLPSLAAAQTQAIDPNLIVKRGEDTVTNGSVVYANVADCGGDPADPDYIKTSTDGVTYEFSVNYNTNVPIVEVWLGVGDNQNCATATNRYLTTSTVTQTICTKLDVDSSNTRRPVFKIPARKIFNQNGASKDAQGRLQCDSVSGTPRYTVYLLSLAQESQSNMAVEVMPGVQSVLKASFSPFTKRPSPPTSVTGINGENRLQVNFSAPPSSVALTKYRAYFDTNKGSGGAAPGTDAGVSDAGDAGSPEDAGAAPVADAGASDAGADGGTASDAGTTNDAGTTTTTTAACGSGLLAGNGVAPVNAAGVIRTSPSDSKSAVLTDLSSVPIGETVAVAVVAIDPAGNESRLSTPICVTRKQTNGFIDTCRANGSDCGLESCSLDPTNRGSALSVALLALVMAALIRRRGRA